MLEHASANLEHGHAMPLATIAWWWAAIKHYLRMPHALAVSIIMSVMCVLMVSAIIFVIGETFAS